LVSIQQDFSFPAAQAQHTKASQHYNPVPSKPKPNSQASGTQATATQPRLLRYSHPATQAGRKNTARVLTIASAGQSLLQLLRSAALRCCVRLCCLQLLQRHHRLLLHLFQLDGKVIRGILNLSLLKLGILNNRLELAGVLRQGAG
jgi:hypothetical protein